MITLAVGFARDDGAAAAPVAADSAAAPVPGREPSSLALPLVETLLPSPRPSRAVVDATGSVAVRNRIDLVPEVSGRVVWVAPQLRVGGSFGAGETLLRIDPQEFQLTLRQAQADLSVARSTQRLRQAESDAARHNYALLHPGKEVPPLVAKEPQIARAKAEVAAARARVDVAQLALARTRFSLPFAGRITQSDAAVGQMLSAGQAFGQSFALDALEVVVPIAQDDLSRLAPVVGREARIVAEGVAWDAVVERVSADLDERTRFAKLYLSLAGQELPRPGTFVDVSLRGPEVANTFVLPEATEQMSGRFWVVDDGRLRSVAPRVIARTGEGVLVEAFDAGDGVVVSVVPGARDGLAVRNSTPDA